MLDASALAQIRPLFITPCYGSQLTTLFAKSLLALNNHCWHVGLNAVISINPGDSLVTRARNESMVEFLANPNFTHLFWIDSDIGFSPEAATRLLLADKDVVAGVYPIKRINWPEIMPAGVSKTEFLANHVDFPINTVLDSVVDADGFLEVTEAPTGFMAIKREVFLTMMARMPELQYNPDGPPTRPNRDLFYRFFDVMVEPQTNRYLSEDYAFCRRWRDLGGQIYIDTQTQLTHQGTFVYEGDFATRYRINPERACGGE